MPAVGRNAARRPVLVLLAATLISVFSGHLSPAEQTPGQAPNGQVFSDAVPGTTTDSASDLTNRIRVNVVRTLRSSSRDEHFIAITLTNFSKETVEGPVAVVVDSTGIDGLTLAKTDGQIDSGSAFVELIPAAGKLEAGQTTRPHRLDFSSSDPLTRTDRDLFGLSCRVLQVGGDASSQQAERTQPRHDLLPGKNYSQNDLNRVMGIQEKWHPQFNAHESVYGTGTAEDAQGNLIVRVYATRSGVSAEVPRQVDGIDVEVVTGDMFRAGPAWTGVVRQNGRKVALPRETVEPLTPIPDNSGSPEAGLQDEPVPGTGTAGEGLDSARLPTDIPLGGQTGLPTIRFTRPVPIGVSSFNVDDPVCAAGTLGCRCVDANGTLYALSNNHVWAAENAAMVDNAIVQPGPLDVNCQSDPVADRIGTLFDFEPLNQTGNTMDAALILADDGTIDACTPDDGYGFPSNLTAQPIIGQDVRKHGRSTGATRGTISAINVMATVAYTTIVADFVNCIEIAHSDLNNPFGAPGDSGSLIVTDPDLRPVGLLFAGSASRTLANPIAPVLARFGVQIDDGSGLAPPARPPRVGYAVPGSN